MSAEPLDNGKCGGCRDLGPHRNVPGCEFYDEELRREDRCPVVGEGRQCTLQNDHRGACNTPGGLPTFDPMSFAGTSTLQGNSFAGRASVTAVACTSCGALLTEYGVTAHGKWHEAIEALLRSNGGKARAWAEGYALGVDDARTADAVQDDIGLGPGNYAQPNRQNPYEGVKP